VHLRLVADPALADSLHGVERSITVAAAAEALSVDASTIRRLLTAGELAGHRVGVKRGAVRIYVSSLSAYQTRNRFDAPPPPSTSPRRRVNPAHREALAHLAGLGILDVRKGGVK
jgi:excisionase family DNA binding protein